MVIFVEVLGCVLILRRIATTDVSAAKAEAQVNPCVPCFYAVFANVLARGLDFDLIEVGASVVHFASPKGYALGSSDYGHLTKVQLSAKTGSLCFTIVRRGFFIRASS